MSARRAKSGHGARAHGRDRGRGHRGRRIALWTTASVVALVVLAGGLVYYRLNGNLSTFGSDGVSKDRPAAASADAEGRTPVNLLLIGSDSRSGSNKSLGGGDDGGARSDTAILLHVYADHKHAVGVSIPRDSLVEIPPCMLPNKSWTKDQPSAMFNSAFSVGDTDAGNPACTQNTVEKLTGLRIDHTMVVNFQGFADMTKAVGGVDVCLPKAVYEGDLNPNLGHRGQELFKAGHQTISGQAALDYVRIRHGLGDGSDIGRTKRQQAFLSSLIKQVKSAGMDPTTLLPLADAATKALTVDEGLGSASKLIDFAMTLKGVDLHDIKFLTVPWRYQGERVAIVHPDADQLWAALRSDHTLDGQDASAVPSATPTATATPAAPASTAPPKPDGAGVRVAVYNGTETAGLTGRAAEALENSGFTVTGRANAASRTHRTTLVEYGTGERAAAEKVAALFPGAVLQPGSRTGIALTLGADYAAGGGTAAAPPVPTGPLPSSVSQARSADQDACADLTYG
ncbi:MULTISPECIES: LCP family protein [Kitasatospora]|uniref:Putative lytR family regulatory protein n=1 Tax=Kitasatospora setae (strain ATCC 33774 / DSM 43861 / JCM 3304 / KCC A-0304 / NBRC 14216 / KM-6054) TaxID=452652 RepID=E4NEE5_KITSK|nr:MULTISPECIES: LCP family protein [Kitasatospora]BAJ29576.1 putative lytR family regulatory protein [Kitasatospora setae KM-6054]